MGGIMVMPDNFIRAKDFRRLSIDELLDSIDIAINVLRDKYAKLLPNVSDAYEIMYYKDRIGYLAKELLDTVF